MSAIVPKRSAVVPARSAVSRVGKIAAELSTRGHIRALTPAFAGLWSRAILPTRQTVPCAVAHPTLAAAVLAAIIALPPRALADKNQPIDQRKALYAPWSPDQMAQRRKEYGLIGPGTTRPVPPPAFPSYLKKPELDRSS